ncbi:uncharacterized protein [Nicotiana sylvestris]|uniref:uncharacterized protein n=1 Tax=Nicotiana sylvestris TaxID=4096 RepID=UPI00388CC42F
MSFLGHLNYISRFIAQSTVICEPIFKMLRKNAETSWTEDYEKAFDKIKEYLSTPPVLVLPEPRRPLLLYLSVLDGAFGCVLVQHDETRRKEQAIYYLKAVKEQALADYLAENLVGGEYEPLKTYLPDEEISFVEEDIVKAYDGWRIFFDGAVNFKGVDIGEVLVQREWAMKNTKILPYLHHVQELMKIFTKVEFKHVRRIQIEFADALASLSSMIQHPDKNFIDPDLVRIHNQPAYCAYVEEEIDGKPWFHDMKEYLARGEYPEQANYTQKCTLRRLSNHFFQSGGTLYRRTPDLELLRCVDAKEASRLLEEVHEDMIRVPPNELNATSAPWPFAAWGMDVIGPIEPTASNRHQFILVAIDYFTKWVEARSYKAVTKKIVADFVKDRNICCFGGSRVHYR